MALSLLTSLSGQRSPVSPSRVKQLTPVFSPFGTGVLFYPECYNAEIATGRLPTGIGFPIVPVVTLTGTHSPRAPSTTNAVLPLGLNATANGRAPTLIDLPGRSVATSIGVRELLTELTT